MNPKDVELANVVGDLFPLDTLLDRTHKLNEEISVQQHWLGQIDTMKSTSYTQTCEPTLVGCYNHFGWRNHVMSVLVADWACYETPVDRVDLNRLLYVAHVFPRGFRVWWCRSFDGRYLPVGYSAWYPISYHAFDVLARHCGDMEDRFVSPRHSPTAHGAAYIFNYSIIKPLQKTSVSRALVKGLALDLERAQQARLSAIAVSADGIRIAKRFGMSNVGSITIQDSSPEHIYVRF